MKNNCCSANYKWVVHLNHTSKKNFDDAKDIVRSNLAAKSDLIALKAELTR